MFRGMTDQQRNVLDRALEQERALETYPFEHEGGRYVTFVSEIDRDDDNEKRYFALMDGNGQLIKLPFCPSPYSGDRDIREWVEAGKPDDSKFHIKNTARRIALLEEEREHKYRSKNH